MIANDQERWRRFHRQRNMTTKGKINEKKEEGGDVDMICIKERYIWDSI